MARKTKQTYAEELARLAVETSERGEAEQNVIVQSITALVRMVRRVGEKCLEHGVAEEREGTKR